MALIDKLHNLNDCRQNSKIYDIYYNEEIDNQVVYLESRNGKDFTGNIFRIVEEISTGKYGNFKIYVYATSEVKSKIKEFEKNYCLKIHKILTDENEACKILEKAKFIFTDSGINPKYTKREGQIVMNTWHGTPLKLIGFDNPSERPSIGIIQRSLIYSDYLLYPNDYMKNKIITAFMIDKIYPGQIILDGYPRNNVFLNNSNLKKILDLEDKEIFVYMPTFKGVVNDRKDEKQKNDVNGFLKEIDLNLKENQVLFVKFHPYNQSQIDFSKFKHIFSFPKGFENYDVLNMADVLITDYSSVFFDFVNTGRKIIIFNYDEEEYLQDRGLYIPLSELPFPKVQRIDDLIDELNLPKNYDDSKFVDEFCKYEHKNSVQRICETVINNNNQCNIKMIENSNKNILVYFESMQNAQVKNQINDILENVGNKEYNIFIAYKSWDKHVNDDYLNVFEGIPDCVEFLPISFNISPTFSEKLDLNKFVKNEGKLNESLKNLFSRSFKRQYGDLNFDLIITVANDDLNQKLQFICSGMNNIILANDLNQNENFSKVYDDISKVNIDDIINGEIK